MFHENHIQPFLNIGHKIVQSYIIGFFKLFREKRFVNSVKIFPENIKSVKAIQKYPHIFESYTCVLKIFAFMFLLLINVFISFGICSTPKESKYATSLFIIYKATQCVPISEYSSRFIT